MAKEILLTQGKFAIVDDNVFEWLAKWRWSVCGSKDRFYARRHCYIMGSALMHREIMGFPDGCMVDHINGDSLDNRRSNLRLATHAQNNRNRVKTNSNSGYLGVTWSKHNKKWLVRVCHDRKQHLVGLFNCAADGAKARDIVAVRLHGSFAGLNFPEIAEMSEAEREKLLESVHELRRAERYRAR